MKKLRVLSCVCLLVLGAVSAVYAFDEEENDIVKRHREWVKKVFAADRTEKPAPSRGTPELRAQQWDDQIPDPDDGEAYAAYTAKRALGWMPGLEGVGYSARSIIQTEGGGWEVVVGVTAIYPGAPTVFHTISLSADFEVLEIDSSRVDIYLGPHPIEVPDVTMDPDIGDRPGRQIDGPGGENPYAVIDDATIGPRTEPLPTELGEKIPVSDDPTIVPRTEELPRELGERPIEVIYLGPHPIEVPDVTMDPDIGDRPGRQIDGPGGENPYAVIDDATIVPRTEELPTKLGRGGIKFVGEMAGKRKALPLVRE